MVKIENHHLNRITQNQSNQTQQIDHQHRLIDRSNEDGLALKDEARVSERARLLVKARAKLDEISDVRTEKVEQLMEQMRNGSYRVPIEALVEKLVDRFKF